MINITERKKEIGDLSPNKIKNNSNDCEVVSILSFDDMNLKPSILKDGQNAVGKLSASLNLVFHGGSGSLIEEIHETLEYGVVKMNVDTDTQYAYTRPLVDHFFKNYDGALKVDGEVGNKKIYDPRSYGKLGEKSMLARVALACDDLRSSGQSICL